MSKSNPGWDHNSDAAPWCDNCGVLCERGYRWHEKDGAIGRIVCMSCADAEDLDEYRATRRLKGRFAITATLKDMRGDARYADAVADVRAVEATIKAFAALAWKDVSDSIDAEKKIAGMSVERDGLKVRSFVSAGRVMLHVERGDAYCCAIGVEGDPSLGLNLQGISATKDEAIALWKDATVLFLSGAKLVANRSVGII